MKNRIYERVKQLQGEDACIGLGEMYVGTIHGYCLQLLETYFGFGVHMVLDENQEMAFLLREGWSLGLGEQGNYSKNCSVFHKSVNVVYNELLDRDLLRSNAASFEEKLNRYEDSLEKHRLITFGSMINTALQKMESPRREAA